MRKKTNDALLWVAVVILAAVLILQTFALKSILVNEITTQPYDRKSFENAEIMKYYRVPIPKKILRSVFSEYSYITENGKRLNLFTNEQYDELLSIRESGIRDSLTVDEILYIIEDSIDLYFTYEEVRFTGCFIEGSGLSNYEMSVAFKAYPEGFYSYEHYYKFFVLDISRIIWFRLLMHDSGFMKVYGRDIDNGNIQISSSVEYPNDRCYYSMLVDDTQVIDDDYKNRLGVAFYTYWKNLNGKEIETAVDYNDISIQSPALTIDFGSGEIVMWDALNLTAIKVFPLDSLDTMVKERLASE